MQLAWATQGRGSVATGSFHAIAHPIIRQVPSVTRIVVSSFGKLFGRLLFEGGGGVVPVHLVRGMREG